MLNQIYDSYVKRYEHTFKRTIINSPDKREILLQRDNEDTDENTISVKDDKFYINDEEVSEEELDEEFTKMEEENFDTIDGLNVREDNEHFGNEQMSLFAPREEELVNKICDIFNSFDTKYQNTFEVHNVELQNFFIPMQK